MSSRYEEEKARMDAVRAKKEKRRRYAGASWEPLWHVCPRTGAHGIPAGL
jgi:hypothetical protein